MAVESGFCSENFGFQDWSFPPFSRVDNLNPPQQTQFHFHPNNGFPATPASSSSSSFSSLSSLTLSSMAALNSELELQSQEIDSFLHFQSEKLRNAIREQRKQQVKALISSTAETEAYRAMREKEADLAEAMEKGRELEERVKMAETEKEAWKRMANTKEAVAMGLQRKLEEAREKVILDGNGAEDAESESGLGCRSCRNRNPCVLFLPCRHVCSCKCCEAFLGCCPVCHSVKEASVEVLLL